MVKDFTYRGKTFEELKKMPLDEFMKLVPSRERRKMKRGFTHVEKALLAKLDTDKEFIKTHARDMVIVPKMVGRKLGVYNGKEHVTVQPTEEMLGHRLGEFAVTRRGVKHSGPGIGATRSSKFVALK